MGSAMCKSESAPLRAAEEGVFVKTRTEGDEGVFVKTKTEGDEDEDLGLIREFNGGDWGEEKKSTGLKEFLYTVDEWWFELLIVEVNLLFNIFVIVPATTYLFADLTNTRLPAFLATLPLPDVLRTILQYTPELLFTCVASMLVGMCSAYIILTWRIEWQLKEQLREVNEILARIQVWGRESRRVRMVELVDNLGEIAGGSEVVGGVKGEEGVNGEKDMNDEKDVSGGGKKK